jgi:hypothetical protein
MISRRPYQIAVTLELEDNVGSIIVKRKKSVMVKIKDGDDDPPVPSAALIEQAFQDFVDNLSDTLEI